MRKDDGVYPSGEVSWQRMEIGIGKNPACLSNAFRRYSFLNVFSCVFYNKK